MFRDLRRGWEASVYRNFEPMLQPAIVLAAEESARIRGSALVDGTPFRVQAEFREIADGNGYFAINAAAPLAGGKIGPGARLCTGIACSTLATAPIAWRWLLNRYLRYVARTPEEIPLAAFGTMPQTVPWVQLYTTHAQDPLSDEERFACDLVTHCLGLIVLRRAEEAAQAAEREGRIFTPDPQEFPELRTDL